MRSVARYYYVDEYYDIIGDYEILLGIMSRRMKLSVSYMTIIIKSMPEVWMNTGIGLLWPSFKL